MPLPTKPTSRAGMPPRRARVLLGGPEKSGKTSTFGDWNPGSSLLIDTHHGSHLLDGEHYIQHVRSWPDFVRTVDDICRGGHEFHTIGLDLVNDLWRFCDLYYGRRDETTGLVFPASSQDDYGRSNAKAKAGFTNVMGRLLTAPIGVWFLTHLQEKTDKKGELTLYKPDIEKNAYSYIAGAADFVWLVEVHANGGRLVHTQPTQHFAASSRGPRHRPMPSPLPLDAWRLAQEMDKVLNPQDYDEKGERIKHAVEVPPSAEADVVAPSEPEPDPQTAPPTKKDLGHDPEQSDVRAEDPWWPPIQAMISDLKLSSGDLKAGLATTGADVPEGRVGNWEKKLTGLSPQRRAVFESWLTAQMAKGTPLEMDVPS